MKGLGWFNQTTVSDPMTNMLDFQQFPSHPALSTTETRAELPCYGTPRLEWSTNTLCELILFSGHNLV